jgi:hypothetical protein
MPSTVTSLGTGFTGEGGNVDGLVGVGSWEGCCPGWVGFGSWEGWFLGWAGFCSGGEVGFGEVGELGPVGVWGPTGIEGLVGKVGVVGKVGINYGGKNGWYNGLLGEAGWASSLRTKLRM